MKIIDSKSKQTLAESQPCAERERKAEPRSEELQAKRERENEAKTQAKRNYFESSKQKISLN